MTVYSIFSSPEPVISSHAWFPFRWWHFAFHPSLFTKGPRDLLYLKQMCQKQMAKRFQNEDLWWKCSVPHIINRKELIKFVILIIKDIYNVPMGFSWNAWFRFSPGAWLLPTCGSGCPSWPRLVNCHCDTVFAFTGIWGAVILLLPQLSPSDICGCFKTSSSTYLSMCGHVRLSLYT